MRGHFPLITENNENFDTKLVFDYNVLMPIS